MVRNAEAWLAYASIKSPLDGIISKQLAEAGDLATPGIILMTVFDPKQIMLYVPISESLVSLLKIGTPLEINVPAVHQTVPAIIREIVPSVDPGSRTFLVKVCIKESGNLMPGMFGTLNLQTGTKSAILIPKTAIMNIGQLEYVMIIRNGEGFKQLIRTIDYSDDMVNVVTGLSPKDKILKNIK